jgi:cell division protein ZapE
MIPSQRYQADVAAERIVADAEQLRIVALFDELLAELIANESRSGGLLQRFKRWRAGGEGTDFVQGLYLWGGVGRGKTYLMDLFCESLGDVPRLRTHFHRFMQRIHQGLIKYQGKKNPLESVADDIASEAKVLCFDEFFVLDIGDAMILAGLLDALFKRGLVIVTTSNIYPDGLYENGLQRERFLPAIALLKRHTRVIEMAPGTDFRLRSLQQAQLYHYPVTTETDRLLREAFHSLATDELNWQHGGEIDVLGRRIPVREDSGDVVWFEFSALCEGPRSANDYVEIARCYHAVLLSNVPELDDTRSDQVRRFINLVDALYDCQVKLILSAHAPLASLYAGKLHAFEFERTRSRLVEMQSEEYLQREHRG